MDLFFQYFHFHGNEKLYSALRLLFLLVNRSIVFQRMSFYREQRAYVPGVNDRLNLSDNDISVGITAIGVEITTLVINQKVRRISPPICSERKPAVGVGNLGLVFGPTNQPTSLHTKSFAVAQRYQFESFYWEKVLVLHK